MDDMIFHSSLGLVFSPKQVIEEIICFMKADLESYYKITLGTDSLKNSGGEMADFVTAIVIHRVGRGGRYFWRRIELGPFYTLRDRIMREVLISLDIAKDFVSHFEEAIKKGNRIPKYDFEIHIDVGENGATKVMIQELVGMIRANNFEAKTKPESYAASNVADRHV